MLLSAVLAALSLSSTAWPCAGMYHDPDAFAESDAQQVILRDLQGSVEVSYRVEYEGDATDFGWVIPIFGEFGAMEDGDLDVFDRLLWDTAPEVRYRYAEDEEEGTGCGSAKGLRNDAVEGGADTSSLDSANVVAEGFTGTYSYTVLEADSADALQTWLTDAGWSIESTLPVIEAYVAEGGVQLVAISLTGADTTDLGLLPPVTITYAGDQLRFPSTMARYGMAETLKTTVYVFGGQRATVSGWSSSTNTDIEGDLYDSSPEGLLQGAQWDAGGDVPGYLEVYSGGHTADFPEAVVTRFDAFASKDAHTVDASFALDGEGEVATVITLVEPGADTGAAWLLVPLLGVGGMLRRRRA